MWKSASFDASKNYLEINSKSFMEKLHFICNHSRFHVRTHQVSTEARRLAKSFLRKVSISFNREIVTEKYSFRFNYIVRQRKTEEKFFRTITCSIRCKCSENQSVIISGYSKFTYQTKKRTQKQKKKKRIFCFLFRFFLHQLNDNLTFAKWFAIFSRMFG